MPVQQDRRGSKRFKPSETVYAVFQPQAVRLGTINDISENGLSVEYILGEEPQPDFTHIDIFLSNDRFHLERLRCRLVYDAPVDESNNLFLGVYLRRCGLELTDLDQAQMLSLEWFLMRFAKHNPRAPQLRSCLA